MRVLRLAGRAWTGVLLAHVLLSAALLVARLAVLPQVSEQPRILSVDPPDGAAGVSPRALLSLRFSQPMNPPSVERVLRIDPPVQAALRWDAPRTTLTISPTESLAPDTAYQVGVGGDALGRMYRPLAAPATARFHTAPAPAVVAVFPADGATAVPLGAPLSVRFSRAIVPAADLMRPLDLPQLRTDPPLAGSTTWLDERTALFRPAEPLRPGTRYQATLDGRLTDLAGGELGRDYRWLFSTAAPRVLAVSPGRGGTLAGPRAPLTITLSQPLDLDAVRSSLSVTPLVPGEVTGALLPDGTQVITFTPSADWKPGAYQAELGRAGQGAPLPLAEPLSWSFSAAPSPALVGRFPGEGQALPAAREIRLIFSTPMDAEAVRAAVQIAPPVSSLDVTARGAEVRIAASLQAATAYTLTLPADLADAAGAQLGREYRLRFLTSPAAPALSLSEVRSRFAYTAPGAPAALLVRRTNLSALSLELFQLDSDTLVRTLALGDGDWTAFEPDRYGLPLVRSWTVPLYDLLNAVVEDRVAVAVAEGGGLPAGAYYLRVRTPEGPRAGAILLASGARLTVQPEGASALVWATDVVSGTPRAGQQLALYQAGALVQQGAADAAGVWSTAPIGGLPFVLLAQGDEPAVATGAAGDRRPPAYALTVVTDRETYRAGEAVEIAGFAQPLDPSAPPPDGLRVEVFDRQGAGGTVASTSLAADGGRYAGRLTLASTLAPGEYAVILSAAGSSAAATITVLPSSSGALAIDVRQQPDGAAVTVRTPEGLPVAGAVVSWTLAAEPLPLPALDGFRVGDAGAAPPPAVTGGGGGEGVTGEGGELRIALPIPAVGEGAAPLRYRLTLRVAEPGGLDGFASAALVSPQARTYVGVRLPTAILRAGRPGTADLLAVDDQGRPVTDARLTVELRRRTWDGPQPQLQLVRSVRATSGADGSASIDLALGAGAYELRAEAAEGGLPTVTSLWVAEDGYTAWGPPPPSRPQLVADRSVYAAGDTAELLLVSPERQTTALVTVAGAGQVSGTLRVIRAGEPLTVTVGAAPETRVTVIAAQGGGSVLAEASLPVSPATRPLSVTLDVGAGPLLPGATAVVTVSTADGEGRRVPAEVILRLAGAYWGATLRTGADGTLTVPVTLPDRPVRLRAEAWAAVGGSTGRAEASLQVGPPLELEIVAPPFLRAGDSSQATALVRSTADVTQELGVAIRGVGPDAGDIVRLGPGESSARSWPLDAGGEGQLALRATVTISGTQALERTLSAAILPASTQPVTAGGALLAQGRTLAIGTAAGGALAVEITPSRGALALGAARQLAALEARTPLDEAGLLLITAPLSETRELAAAAAARIERLRDRSGGWPLWPGGAAEPFATAAALEALAAARDAGIAVSAAATDPALGDMRQIARDAGAPADLRAYALYVLARYGRPEAAASATLAASPAQLSPDGLALLLLARTPGEARAERDLVARLERLARQDAAGVHWLAASAALPHTDVARTALAARALEHARPGSALAAQARRWLAAARPVGGWPGGYGSARAVAALAPALPAAAPAYTVTLDGEEILAAAAGEERAQRQALPTAQGGAAALALHAAEELLVSYSASDPAAAPDSGDVAVLREYLDPLSSAPLDVAALQPGQLVRVRLTLVVAQARVLAAVEEPLPAGFALVGAEGGDVVYVERRPSTLALWSTRLEPGVHEHSYLLRAVTPGRYAAPATVVRQADGAVLGVGRDALLLVGGGPAN